MAECNDVCENTASYLEISSCICYKVKQR